MTYQNQQDCKIHDYLRKQKGKLLLVLPTENAWRFLKQNYGSMSLLTKRNCIWIDDAPVMVKFGKFCDADHPLCFKH